MWFQNRRAKWRKKENTRKGPGRPSHTAKPQTASGIPVDPEEVKKRELERLERRRQRQEEKRRLRAAQGGTGQMMEDKASSGEEDDGDQYMEEEEEDEDIDVVGEDLSTSHHEHLHPEDHSVGTDSTRQCLSTSVPVDLAVSKPPAAKDFRQSYDIDSLLQADKVPRGRRPNSKYPRVQASKSMQLLSGMIPLFPPTQPVGFQVEQVREVIKAQESSHHGADMVREIQHHTTVQQPSLQNMKVEHLTMSTSPSPQSAPISPSVSDVTSHLNSNAQYHTSHIHLKTDHNEPIV